MDNEFDLSKISLKNIVDTIVDDEVLSASDKVRILKDRRYKMHLQLKYKVLNKETRSVLRKGMRYMTECINNLNNLNSIKS